MSFLYNQFSVFLFLAAYFNLGWLLATSAVPVWNWLLVAVSIVLVAEALASPWAIMRKFFFRWISTDTKAFFAVTFGAMLTVIILSWFHVFTQILLLVVSACLIRLNLQTAAIGDSKAFAILSFLSLASMGAGGGSNWLFHHGDLVMKLVIGSR